MAELFPSFVLTEIVENPDKQHTRFTDFFGWWTQNFKRLQFCVFNSSHSGIIEQEGYHNFYRAIWIKYSQDPNGAPPDFSLRESDYVSYSKLIWIPHLNQKTWRVMLPLLQVPAILHQELLQRETFHGFVYCRDSEPAHTTMAHWG